MITKEMIRDGIKNGRVAFVGDPNMGSGTVCEIGDGCSSNWFYFGGQTAEETNPREFLQNANMEDIISNIYDVLQDFAQSDDVYGDEYHFYEAVLRGE